MAHHGHPACSWCRSSGDGLSLARVAFGGGFRLHPKCVEEVAHQLVKADGDGEVGKLIDGECVQRVRAFGLAERVIGQQQVGEAQQNGFLLPEVLRRPRLGGGNVPRSDRWRARC